MDTGTAGDGRAQQSTLDPREKGIAGWRLTTATVARVALFGWLTLALWGALPAALRWQPTTVVTGSMQPRIAVGDVVVAMPVPAGEVRPGQVLLMDDPDQPGQLRLHRLVRVDEGGSLITKGDANPDEDSTPTEAAAVHGVGVLRVPYVGLPVLWARTGQVVPLLAFTGAVLVALAATRLDRERPDRALPAAAPAPGAKPSARPPRRRVRRRATVAVVCTIGLATVAVGATAANAAFTARATGPESTWSAADYFRCSEAITKPISPELYYPLNDGTAMDASVNKRHGSTVGSVGRVGSAQAACPRDGGAVQLSGNNAHIASSWKVESAPDTFTIELWFATTSTSGGRLIGFGDENIIRAFARRDRQVYLGNDGRVHFGVYPGRVVEVVSSRQSYNDGRWHHVAATLSPAGMALYLDGELVTSRSEVTTGQEYDWSLSCFCSGGSWRVGSDSLSGWQPRPTSTTPAARIDEVAVYHTALDPTLIADQHEAGR